MTPESKGNPTPEWDLRQRERDLGWIRENLEVFWAAASGAYEMGGRGAVVVDATGWPIEGQPPGEVAFGYFTQTNVERRDDEDIKRMVREYDPQTEFVIVLLKPERRSSYRVQLRPKAGE